MKIKRDILIADDERNIRLMLRTTLESGGYSVREASSAAELLDAVHDKLPDVVLLDLWMPDFVGMDLLRRLKAGSGSGSKPGIVILTGHGSRPLTVEAMRLGASDFLQKPVTPLDVRLSVDSVVDESEEMRGMTPESIYRQMLRTIRRDLVHHNFKHAGEMLDLAAEHGRCDADFYNLLGMLNEAEGRPMMAQKFYRCAMAAEMEIDNLRHARRHPRHDRN